MNEIVMMQAALFRVRAAIGSIEDPFTRSQVQLASDVFGNALAGAASEFNAARVGEIDFAFNDLVGAASDLSAADAEALAPAFEVLRTDLDALKSMVALPHEIVTAIRELVRKLKVRRAAIERQTYVENAAASSLPHPPEELSGEAIVIRDRLLSAGYATPALDILIEDPSSLRFHSINEIVDELEVIAGAE
jgi:hypothetical protein